MTLFPRITTFTNSFILLIELTWLSLPEVAISYLNTYFNTHIMIISDCLTFSKIPDIARIC